MKHKTWLIIAVMLALMLVPILSATASDSVTNTYHAGQDLSSGQDDLERTNFGSITLLQSVMAAGGGLSRSANYVVHDTLGQPIGGQEAKMQSNNYQVTSGFWAYASTDSSITPTPTPTSTPLSNTPTPTPTSTPSVTVTPTPSTCPWDFDNDGDVDISDVQAVAFRWNTSVGDELYDALYDLDGDGDIDISDVQAVAFNWGTSCPTAAHRAIRAVNGKV